MVKGKPTILWLADMHGWAYASIVQNVSRHLNQYNHIVYYMCEPHYDVHRDLIDMLAEIDIIVPMYVPYLSAMESKPNRAVLMLTGPRIFE